eukprot:g14073.t1
MLISETRIWPLESSIETILVHAEHIYVGTADGDIVAYHLQDLRHPEAVLASEHHRGRICSLEISIAETNKNGKFLYSASEGDGCVLCWDVTHLGASPSFSSSTSTSQRPLLPSKKRQMNVDLPSQHQRKQHFEHLMLELKTRHNSDMLANYRVDPDTVAEFEKNLAQEKVEAALLNDDPSTASGQVYAEDDPGYSTNGFGAWKTVTESKFPLFSAGPDFGGTEALGTSAEPLLGSAVSDQIARFFSTQQADADPSRNLGGGKNEASKAGASTTDNKLPVQVVHLSGELHPDEASFAEKWGFPLSPTSFLQNFLNAGAGGTTSSMANASTAAGTSSASNSASCSSSSSFLETQSGEGDERLGQGLVGLSELDQAFQVDFRTSTSPTPAAPFSGSGKDKAANSDSVPQQQEVVVPTPAAALHDRDRDEELDRDEGGASSEASGALGHDLPRARASPSDDVRTGIYHRLLEVNRNRLRNGTAPSKGLVDVSAEPSEDSNSTSGEEAESQSQTQTEDEESELREDGTAHVIARNGGGGGAKKGGKAASTAKEAKMGGATSRKASTVAHQAAGAGSAGAENTRGKKKNQKPPKWKGLAPGLALKVAETQHPGHNSFDGAQKLELQPVGRIYPHAKLPVADMVTCKNLGVLTIGDDCTLRRVGFFPFEKELQKAQVREDERAVVTTAAAVGVSGRIALAAKKWAGRSTKAKGRSGSPSAATEVADHRSSGADHGAPGGGDPGKKGTTAGASASSSSSSPGKNSSPTKKLPSLQVPPGSSSRPRGRPVTNSRAASGSGTNTKTKQKDRTPARALTPPAPPKGVLDLIRTSRGQSLAEVAKQYRNSSNPEQAKWYKKIEPTGGFALLEELLPSLGGLNLGLGREGSAFGLGGGSSSGGLHSHPLNGGQYINQIGGGPGTSLTTSLLAGPLGGVLGALGGDFLSKPRSRKPSWKDPTVGMAGGGLAIADYGQKGSSGGAGDHGDHMEHSTATSGEKQQKREPSPEPVPRGFTELTVSPALVPGLSLASASRSPEPPPAHNANSKDHNADHLLENISLLQISKRKQSNSRSPKRAAGANTDSSTASPQHLREGDHNAAKEMVTSSKKSGRPNKNLQLPNKRNKNEGSSTEVEQLEPVDPSEDPSATRIMMERDEEDRKFLMNVLKKKQEKPLSLIARKDKALGIVREFAGKLKKAAEITRKKKIRAEAGVEWRFGDDGGESGQIPSASSSSASPFRPVKLVLLRRENNAHESGCSSPASTEECKRDSCFVAVGCANGEIFVLRLSDSSKSKTAECVGRFSHCSTHCSTTLLRGLVFLGVDVFGENHSSKDADEQFWRFSSDHEDVVGGEVGEGDRKSPNKKRGKKIGKPGTATRTSESSIRLVDASQLLEKMKVKSRRKSCGSLAPAARGGSGDHAAEEDAAKEVFANSCVPLQIATASVDGCVKVWTLRRAESCVDTAGNLVNYHRKTTTVMKSKPAGRAYRIQAMAEATLGRRRHVFFGGGEGVLRCYLEDVEVVGGGGGGAAGGVEEDRVVEEHRTASSIKTDETAPADHYFSGTRGHLNSGVSHEEFFGYRVGVGASLSAGGATGVDENKMSKRQGESVTQVECGALHVVVLSDDGLVYTWGGRDQIGRQNAALTDFDPKPGLVSGIKKKAANATSAGEGGTNEQAITPGTTAATTPGAAKILPCVQIGCGYDHSVALTAEGDVFAWGVGKSGQLGLPLTFFERAQFVARLPEQVGLPEKVQRVAANGRSTCACTVSGRLFVWGEAAAAVYGSKNAFVPQEIAAGGLSPTLSLSMLEEKELCFDDLSIGKKGVACTLRDSDLTEEYAARASTLN